MKLQSPDPNPFTLFLFLYFFFGLFILSFFLSFFQFWSFLPPFYAITEIKFAYHSSTASRWTTKRMLSKGLLGWTGNVA